MIHTIEADIEVRRQALASMCFRLAACFADAQAVHVTVAYCFKTNQKRVRLLAKKFTEIQGLRPGGVLQYITYTGMCRPTGS